jgi:hypothetical protein
MFVFRNTSPTVERNVASVAPFARATPSIVAKAHHPMMRYGVSFGLANIFFTTSTPIT